MKRYSDNVMNASGQAIFGATITVKNHSGGTLATIYSDDGITPTANPVTSAADGTFSFYVADGRYDLVCAFGSTTVTTSDVEIADITEKNSGDATAKFTALQVGNLESVRFANEFATVQLAINDLPASGGTVYIPDGTYVGPTAIPSNVKLIAWNMTVPDSFIQGSGATGSSSATFTGVRLTYTSGLTLANVSNIALLGLTFDFQSNNAGLTFQSVIYSHFDIIVLNCGTAAGITLNTGTGATPGFNTALNKFYRCYVYNAGKGMVWQGFNNQSFVTENYFGDLLFVGCTTQGLEMVRYCDSNTVDGLRTFGLGLAANGIVVNTDAPASARDADGCLFRYVSISYAAGVATGFPVLVNNSVGNTFFMGFGQGGAATNVGAVQIANGGQCNIIRLQATINNHFLSNGFAGLESGVAPTNISGYSQFYSDLNTHRWKMINAGSTSAVLGDTTTDTVTGKTFQGPNGSANIPTYAFSENIKTGFYKRSTQDEVVYSANGVVVVDLTANAIRAKSSTGYGFSSGDPTVAVEDTALWRTGPAAASIGNGSAGDFSGQLKLGNEILTSAAPTVAAAQVGLGSTTATTATAGANGAVPAQVVGYLIVNIAGTAMKIPYFNT